MKTKANKGFIDNQRTLSRKRGTFGPFGSLSDNSCGAVALYNAMLFLEGCSDFPSISNDICQGGFGTLILGGRLGVMPWRLIGYLKQRGYRARRYRGTKRNLKYLDDLALGPHHQAYMILYLWISGVHCGAHYQAAWRTEAHVLITRNEFGRDKGFTDWKNRKQKREGLRIMWIWGIDK